MILEKFYTNQYDNEIILVHKDKKVSLLELKNLIFNQFLNFQKKEEKNLILLGDSSFEFIINFFAGLFANKKLYLISDKNRIKSLNFEYILPNKIEKPDIRENIYFDKINKEEVQINFFTSGSSGVPKTITKNFQNVENEAIAFMEQFNLEEKNLEIFSTTIMTHLFGFTVHFLVPLYSNLLINTERIEYPEQLETRNENYFLVSSPSFLEKMAKYNTHFAKAPQKIFTAGAKLKKEVEEFFAKDSSIIEIYGSSETGVVGYRNKANYFTAFKPVAFATNKEGCIIVKSNFFKEEKVILADIIKELSDNKFVIIGRNDRLVKIKEKRISLIEIENILKKHPKIIDAYCDKYEDSLASIVVTKDETLEEKELKTFVGQFSEIAPKKWRFLDEIPKTTTGKIDKEKINKIFGLNLTYPFVFSKTKIENGYDIELIFKEKSNFFRGHFDIMPILPGVVQLFFANWFIKEMFNIEVSTKEVKKVKFTNIIKANEKVILRLEEKNSHIEYTYLANDKVCSSGIFIK